MKQVGAIYTGKGNCSFNVWAPLKKSMQLHVVHPEDRIIEMQKNAEGYFACKVEGVFPGTRYFFRPEGKEDYPDPASHFQPEGVHGPSEVIDHSHFTWKDENWQPLPLNELVLYEVHVGTFTEQGTFEAIIERLDDLVDTGINAIELMPVAQCPGGRNWGYDGVYPYAIQNAYGSVEGLKMLVDACHEKGIVVFFGCCL